MQNLTRKGRRKLFIARWKLAGAWVNMSGKLNGTAEMRFASLLVSNLLVLDDI
jgi:hypothetical protein